MVRAAKETFFIGVAGGTGSGKTTVTERVLATLGSDKVTVLVQDNYYLDQSHLSFEERLKTNYDHPSAFDWELMQSHLEALARGENIHMPIYDFVHHTRSSKTTLLQSAPVLLLEGILALYEAKIYQQMQLKIFVHTDDDVRFIRRLSRDMKERGRSVDNVIQQYLEQVRPMHIQFVEPTMRNADVIIPHGGHNEPALDMIAARIGALL